MERPLYDRGITDKKERRVLTRM
ncbi:hypothetical protein LCGC14_2306850, partial [marine sediment metagenome]